MSNQPSPTTAALREEIIDLCAKYDRAVTKMPDQIMHLINKAV